MKPVTDPIIDAHHHIWRLGETPWLQGPPVPRPFDAIRGDYTIEEYLADATPCGVVKSVFVQVNVAPAREAEEVAWVQSVADRRGFPQAITAFADLSATSRSRSCGPTTLGSSERYMPASRDTPTTNGALCCTTRQRVIGCEACNLRACRLIHVQ